MGLYFPNIGRPIGPSVFTYTPDQVILYALGIGADVETDLEFLYEKNLRVFPSFCVVPGSAEVSDWHMLVGIDMKHLLQVSHEIELHGSIPPSGTLYTTTLYDPVYDMGESGALIHMKVETRDEEGTLLFINRCVLIERSAGHFGGEKPPQPESKEPPEGRNPDFQVSYPTSPNQAALYRLSGDKNLMHIDPEFARSSGFERPILHGLCTFGFSSRAVLHNICKRDPSLLRSFKARFVGAVYPGETLHIQGWRLDEKEYFIRTHTGAGKLVMDNGLAVVV